MDNWDDVRIFLAIARQGGLAPAAQSLGINHTTAARRLTRLETSLKARLVIRTPVGVTLTSAGSELLQYAERIEYETSAAQQHLHSPKGELSGKVRVGTREAFGTWLVCPKVDILLKRHPGLMLELVPEARTVSLLKHDADITVSLAYPSQKRVIVQKLTDYRLGLYASRAYLKEHGPVTGLEDLKNREVIWYIGDMVDMDEQRYMQSIVSTSRSGFRATNILAQYEAVTSGVGIGIIPVYKASQDNKLVRVLPKKVEEMRTYWLSVHPDSRNLPNIRAVIDFLVEIVRDKRALF